MKHNVYLEPRFNRPQFLALMLITATLSICGWMMESVAADTSSQKENSQGEESATTSPVVLKVRYVHPFGSVDFAFSKEAHESPYTIINLIDMSLGIEVISLISAEFGGYYELANIMSGKSHGFFGRVGLMPVILDRLRPDNRGSTIQLGGLAGIRGIVNDSSHDGDYYYKGIFATLAVALEYTYRVKSNFGICFRVLADTGLPFYQTSSDDWARSEGDRSWFLRFALAAGVVI
jgi:hypothetical protein